MNPKRFIGVITVKDGRAVQSIGYEKYLPIGDPTVLLRTLGRWGLDEVVIQCIDRTTRALGPDLDLLSRISESYVGVPLTYVGGIRDEADANRVINTGADRVGIDALLRKDPDLACSLADRIGAQAVVGVFPLVENQFGAAPSVLNYRAKHLMPLEEELDRLGEQFPFAEALVIDVAREGSLAGFSTKLLSTFANHKIPVLALGGISTSDQVSSVAKNPCVQGVCIENSLFYNELAYANVIKTASLFRAPKISKSWHFDPVL